MKKFIASVLSAAMLFGCVSISVSADVPTSSSYTIDTSAKTITNVPPLTTVATFESNISGATVDVVNVDGSSMSDSAYATDNVYASIDGELYTIKTKYAYAPVRDTGSTLADGASLYNLTADAVNNNSLSGNGFTRLEAWAKIGYGSDNASPANTSSQTVKGEKQTRNGKTVYKLENDSNKYAYLRSHYSSSTNYSTTLNNAIDSWAENPIITTVEFEADKLGNISVFNNTPVRNDSKAITRGDSSIENLIYSAECPYAPNSVHFLEDGSVKLGGVYSNYTAAQRAPIQATTFTWSPGVKYKVSIVQRYLRGTRNAYVDGVYINGTKVFPNANTVSHGDGRVALQQDGTFKIGTKDSSITHGGGLSSIMVGTAPETADDNLTVYLSDLKYYTTASFNPAIDASDISISNAAGVTVTENDESGNPAITDSVADTVGSLKAKYDDTIMGVYNADGSIASDSDLLVTGMVAKIASENGLQGKVYKINVKSTDPQSTVYTVNTSTKVVSNVKPLTTVSAFLADFENGSDMKVLNIDGSEMTGSAYATENVYLEAPNGELYAINVKWPYSPIQSAGGALADDTTIYNMAANSISNNSLSSGGFERLQLYAKIGYGSDNLVPSSSSNVNAKKTTINGEPVYVMNNASNKYAYLRSHYSTSTNYSTDLNNAIDSWTTNPIITTVEFEADKLGNISVFNNTPVRDGSKNITKGDSGADALFYSVELKYVPNSVHFLEDGSVKLGGIYSSYSTEQRTPIQTTNFTWEPGKKYKVSIVQRYIRGTRNAYVDGVYINGTKVFPNENTVSHSDGRVALQQDGTFKIGTKSNDVTHGGGLSSIMVGTAPKTADDNLTVYLSDVKYYTASSYNPAADNDITVSSSNPAIFVDNDKAEITCTGMVSESDFTSSAKLKIEDGYLKAVSADGLVAKTYSITNGVVKGFYAGEDGNRITSLNDADDSVCFMAQFNAETTLDGTEPVVMLAVYDKTTHELIDVVMASEPKTGGEITRYKAVIDISELDKNNIEFKGYVWGDNEHIEPVTDVSTL